MAEQQPGPSGAETYTGTTFAIEDEDHTLANSLRFFLNKKWVCAGRPRAGRPLPSSAAALPPTHRPARAATRAWFTGGSPCPCEVRGIRQTAAPEAPPLSLPSAAAPAAPTWRSAATASPTRRSTWSTCACRPQVRWRKRGRLCSTVQHSAPCRPKGAPLRGRTCACPHPRHCPHPASSSRHAAPPPV
jgi:hypothetical protein